jgi:hypothetical protein
LALRVSGSLVALALLGSSSAICAQDAASANRLVYRLYTDTKHVGERSPYPLWWRFLSARTKAQHVQLRALDAQSGDASIDYDWLCQCQDAADLRVTSVKLSNMSSDHVSAIAQFANGRDRQTLRLLLVREGTWKIDDMINQQGRRFTDDLRAGLKRYANAANR